MIITIDGPSGSGKSTISKLLSEKLSYSYLNSGAFYRGITYIAQLYNHIVNEEIDKDFWNLYCNSIIPEMNWEDNYLLVYPDNTIKENNQRVFKLQEELFTNTIDKMVAKVSSTPKLREAINMRIRDICKNDWIVEGRDAGSQIFPNAELKFYLDASLEVRAQRRANQYSNSKLNSDNITKLEIADSLQKRDYVDSNKGKYSLQKINQSIHIDTSSYTIEQTFEKLYNIVNIYNQNN